MSGLPIRDPEFEQGIALILKALARAREQGRPGLTPAGMEAELARLAELRGRPPFYAYLGSGVGRGARAMMADGRWVLDFALGVGVHFFGHGDPDLIETALRAAASDLVMQGNLIFNREYAALMGTLLDHAPAGMAHCWLSLSGADANENALKALRQHRDGRPGIVAFSNCFHGRTSAMAEITDRPDYRLKQPSTFPVYYVPFFERGDPHSISKSLAALREIISTGGDRIGAFVVELVQGEAGFITAPREFFVPLFEECREAKIPIWIDEIQTFARVSELFATDLLQLSEYADVITIGKVLQGSAMLTRREMAPGPGLVSGTFSGATVAMAVGRRIVDRLVEGNFFGPEGREKQIERLCRAHLERLARDHPGMVSAVDGVGAMVAFRIGGGSLKTTQDFIQRCFTAGLALYYGGHEPACVRLFMPAGILDDAEVDEAFTIIERCF